MAKQRVESAPADRLSRETLYWLIAAQTLAIIPLLAHLPPWVSLCAAATVILSFSLATLGKPLRSKWVIIITAIAAAAFVFTSYGTIAGRDAGVALLTLMLGLKILEIRGRRDAIVSTFMIYFLLLTGFFFSQSIPIALYMCPAVVIITACLIQINQGSQHIPANEKLRVATRMLLQSIPFMLVMFILFPRLSGPLWTLGQDSSSAISGLSDEMSPGNISKLILSDAIAFRVGFKEQPPPASERYWRGPVFWIYDGRTWRPRKFSRFLNEFETGGEDDRIEYTVTLEPHDKHWLFALDTPVSAPQGATINSDYQLLSVQPIKQRKTYSTASSSTLKNNVRLSRFENLMALDLPQGAAPRGQELAEQWRATLPGPAAIVNRALEFFSEQQFSYTLNPPILGASPVDEFLFDTRQGFCEHYAGSFVVLMRAAGIPARVVTGYLGGEWNPLGEYLLVRQADAHAWAEVWLPGEGWQRVDPTAAVSPDRV
ncbi:MAG: transglutaminaseTgpA domain-containing protein, partial [Gammaproteobacteria bacterium]